MYIAIVLELDQVTIDLPSVGQLIGLAVLFIIILWIGTDDYTPWKLSLVCTSLTKIISSDCAYILKKKKKNILALSYIYRDYFNLNSDQNNPSHHQMKNILKIINILAIASPSEDYFNLKRD